MHLNQFSYFSKNRRPPNRTSNDKNESLKLQRTPSSNSGLRIVGSGTNLSLMGELPSCIINHESPTSSSSQINRREQQHSIAVGGGSLRSFPVHRESASMTDITDMMYLQQRKCENCSHLIVPSSLRSNW